MTEAKLKQSKKRICHISTVHPSTDVRIFYRECRSLVTAGYEVHLVIPCEQGCVKDGVHLHCIRRVKHRFLRILFMPWMAMSKALQTKSSLYHYHDPELLFMGFVLRWLFGKKVIFDVHESVSQQMMSKAYLPWFTRKPISLCYKFCERIFTAGQALVVANKKSVTDFSSSTYLVQNYPLLNEEIIAIATDEKQRSKDPLLIYVGSVAKIRGAMVYVELADKLANRGHDFHMYIVGSYNKEFGRELKLKIEKLHLQDRVLLTGHVDWSKAMKLVSRATIGLCLLLPTPNYTRCLATKIIEYMMCGTPVLCSRFDHWQAYVEDERTGFMVDPNNIDEVVTVCERMLGDPDELAAMGKRGIEAVHSKYNWSSEFQELLRCYKDLLNSNLPE